ncbi:MAG: imidazole glycerol phosphate synthase subunit HisF [Spirochaetes bacterium]|nr:MAG: imidazole glycerol phosphate synthase subunit HisF [Spirochaetota bacterium]RKX98016.1 MAG: imidazole glycerol phosphate synthase subunit HisF [Spirochaetota bacterium]
MFQKRIVVCLDVRDGKTTKGIRFQGNVDIGDPVQMAQEYYLQGVDELVFYDITASAERRGIMIDVVRRVAEKIFIPFCVGGGIATVDDMSAVIMAGAEKVSINSAAVRNPSIITGGARRYGSQCIVLGMDAEADSSMPSGYGIVIDGGRVKTGKDMLEWAKEAESLGAGEIVLNSIDADGTRDGYEITATRLVSESVGIPVVASGGAGNPGHLVEVLTRGKADAALVASMVHYGDFSVGDIKKELSESNVPVRLD